ncbi:hypothetical protein HK102_009463, partial [Quaeritorhiza haematococci]
MAETKPGTSPPATKGSSPPSTSTPPRTWALALFISTYSPLLLALVILLHSTHEFYYHFVLSPETAAEMNASFQKKATLKNGFRAIDGRFMASWYTPHLWVVMGMHVGPAMVWSLIAPFQISP